MFLSKQMHAAYWNSYKLLESQLLRVSHSVCFDDKQIDVYSSELADIINSACVKIESLAKDIYEEHIWPFQMDDKIVPQSYNSTSKFKPEKWTREKWKFDYNCLIEIDQKFSLRKKRIELKAERFHFQKYGCTILPFGNISLDDCKGGFWEHSEHDIWHLDLHKLQPVDWCKSYQAIKHNYIESIPMHGTVKNAIMTLAAFYLLTVYHTCLPNRQFEMLEKNRNLQLDFGSELFSCSMCLHTTPPCIINSKRVRYEDERKKQIEKEGQSDINVEQDLLNDIEGFPFLITLNNEAYGKVSRLVAEYCTPRKLERFDIAPYEKGNDALTADAGTTLYLSLAGYIIPPHHPKNICIAFNTGLASVYGNLSMDSFEYEKSKYTKMTTAILATLEVGDSVDAKFIFNAEVKNGKVQKIDEHSIDLSVQVNGTAHTMSQPKSNIIYIRKLNETYK